MGNPDIENTLVFQQLAEEAIVGMRLPPSVQFSSLPQRTLLSAFADSVAALDIDDMIAKFPLLTEFIRERCSNNPVLFDWGTLAVAVDNERHHYVCGLGMLLNTK